MAGYYRFGSWFHPYGDRSVARRGRRDGGLTPPIPAWKDKNQPPFVMQLKQLGDSHMRDIGEAWSGLNKRLKGEIDGLRKELEHREHLQQEAEGHHGKAEAAYDREHTLPAPVSRGPAFFYWILLLFLALSELPMNKMVFQLFPENDVLNFGMALAIGVGLVICAHVLGEMLREGQYQKRTNSIFVGVLMVVPLLVIGMVAMLREYYLETQPDLPATLKEHQTSLYVAFAGFNLLLFLGGTVLSYRHHEQSLSRLLDRRKLLSRSKASRADLEQEIEKLETERVKLFQVHHLRAMQLKDAVERVTALYRTHNLEVRNDRADHPNEGQPWNFLKNVEVKIPEHLVQIDADISTTGLAQKPRETPDPDSETHEEEERLSGDKET